MYDKVRLLRHPSGKNRGAGSSRNLGMKNAQYDFIAFLDADDYFLPNRFMTTKKVFESDPQCDGVYEAMGIHFEDEKAKEGWMSSSMAGITLTTMTTLLSPEQLFERLVICDRGYFSLNGLTIKKEVLRKVGMMNEGLVLHQDTEFILRLSAVARLLPGQLEEPISVRRVHSSNRVSAPISVHRAYRNQMDFWMSTYRWMKNINLINEREIIFNRLTSKSMNYKHYGNSLDRFLPASLLQRMRLLLTAMEYPELLCEPKLYSKFIPGFFKTTMSSRK